MEVFKGILAFGAWFGSMYLLRDLATSSEIINVIIFFLVPAFVLYWGLCWADKDRNPKSSGAIVIVVMAVLAGLASAANGNMNYFVACAITALVFFIIASQSKTNI